MDLSEAYSSLELAVLDDGVNVHPLPPRGRVAIGRASGNDVRIQHPSISRRHAISCGVFEKTLTNLDVPSLKDVDPALMTELDDVATNGVSSE